jgi:hypothetical protein
VDNRAPGDGATPKRNEELSMHARPGRGDDVRERLTRPGDAAAVVSLVVLLFVLSRVSMYLVFGVVRSDFSADGIVKALCQWDCGWYVHTAAFGYDGAPTRHEAGDAANWAFFPLYPLLLAGIRSALGLETAWAGLLVSNAAALAAGLVAARLVANLGQLAAFCLVLYFGPFSFYFASVYTESLFVLLTLACFYLLKHRLYLAAGLAAALLSGTRAVGVFMALIIVLSALRDHLAEGRPLRAFPRAALANPELVLGIVLAPLGLFLFMAYLDILTGDALAFSHIQRAWSREVGNPLTVLTQALATHDLHVLAHGGLSARWCALWTLAALALTAHLAWRRRFPEAVFALFCLLLPLSTSIDSMPRYAIGTAPLLLALGQIMGRSSVTLAVSAPLLVPSNLPLLVWWAQAHHTLI